MIRDRLNEAVDLAREIHAKEKILIHKLYYIDRETFYVRYGFNSLMGFCRFGLKFSRTQAQRIATQVRRHEPTANFPDGEGKEL
jgi:hypothetical protein